MKSRRKLFSGGRTDPLPLLIPLGRLCSFGEGVLEWKNRLLVKNGWGGQPAGNLGNGMEWNVGFGNTESGDIGGGSAGQRFEKK